MQIKEEIDLVVNEHRKVNEPHTNDTVKEPKGKLLHIKNGQKEIDFRGILSYPNM